jgi:hypothetical protein
MIVHTVKSLSGGTSRKAFSFLFWKYTAGGQKLRFCALRDFLKPNREARKVR